MGKMRFSLKELFLSVTLIAVGLGMPVYYVWIVKSHIRLVRPGPWEIYADLFQFLLLLSAASLIGAGVLLPFKRPMRGALVGLWLDVLLILAFVARVFYLFTHGKLFLGWGPE